MKRPRAIGIVRVSRTAGREGESFVSPADQADRIRRECEQGGMELLRIVDELDVSGGTPLEERAGLRDAVLAVEAGQADVIVAAYFDRLTRSLEVQAQLIARVEAAGGQVFAVDVGLVTNGSAGQWMNSTLLGAMAEYVRRAAAERSGEAQRRSVARGVAPFPRIPPGYYRGEDGCLVPDPTTAPTVAEAFSRRANGATIEEIRGFLRANGIERSYHGVSSLLASRVVLGQVHFGDLVNETAHPGIVDPDIWRAVQRMSVPRGRRAKSDNLLARQGVLRCGTCGARLVVGTANNRGYRLYRCPPTNDCPRRVTISATVAEAAVEEAVRNYLDDAEGRASAVTEVLDAERELETTQLAFDRAVKSFDGMTDEPSVADKLSELREARDLARGRVNQLAGAGDALTVSLATDWDRLTLDERRALIRATVQSAVVAPGRGPDRLAISLFSA